MSQIGITLFYTPLHFTGLSFRTKSALKQFLTRLGDYDSRWYEVIIYPIKRGKLPLNATLTLDKERSLICP